MQSPISENRWLELFRAGHVWGSEWNLDNLVGRIASDTHRFFRWDTAAVFLLEASGLALKAASPADRTFEPQAMQLARESIRTGHVTYGHDLSRLKSAEGGASTIVCAPLTASRGVLGALYLASSMRQLGDEDADFLEALALQAATALEHVSLFNSAITDPLTGLLTHRHFQQEVEQAIRRAARSEQPVSLVLLDLDHFKQLNDTCGHAVGNTCLTAVAAVLKKTLRATDAIARFGGDEFEVLLPDTPLDHAAMVAEKLRQQIASFDFQVRISGTFGVASCPLNALDATALFLRADAALYEAKEAGRNQVKTSAQREEAPRKHPRDERRPSHEPAPERRDGGSIPVEKIDGYELLGRLGTGTNGEVLLVRQPELEREVALKRPLTPFLTPEQMRAFELEARVTASLNHPGVVTVHTMGRDSDGRRYYTMKPLEGKSLAHVLNERRKGNASMRREFPITRLLEILQRACEALSYAHKRGVYHLDLTPSNIIIGDFGEVTVIDWGMGASHSGSDPAAESSSRLSVVAGSPRYIAPEQLPSSGGNAGPHSDIFALGAILYEILADKPPFAGKNVSETFDLLLKGNLLAPELAAPDAGIAPALSALCMSALARSPGERPNAQELTERLGRYVRREPEWVLTKFDAEHPLREEEWQHIGESWKLIDGEWVSTRSGHWEAAVMWKVPVQGSFRFIAEGRLDQLNGELAMFARASTIAGANAGYSFHAASENNSLSKLCRNGVAVAVSGDFAAEPGRKYRLELEYDEEDGWVRCYIDERQIFAFRELFPTSGRHVGFYGCGPGAHMRPLEIHRRIWGLQVPAIRIADSLLECGAYEAALDKYGALNERSANRLEGAEARLKMGLCLAHLKKFDEAETMFKSLADTPLEPLGLAEQGLMCMRRNGEPWRGARIIADVLRRFPQHQARWRITQKLNSQFSWSGADTGLPLEEHLRLYESMFTSTSRFLKPMPFSQTHVRLQLINLYTLQGAWPLALAEAQAVIADLNERQKAIATPWLFVTAVANGRDDLLYYDPATLVENDYWARDWASGFALHAVLRLNQAGDYIAHCTSRHLKGAPLNAIVWQDVLQIAIASGQMDKADVHFDRLIACMTERSERWVWFLQDICTSLVECDCEVLLDRFMSRMNIAAGHPDIHASALSQLAMERGDLATAAALLNAEMPASIQDSHNTGQLRQILLHSLGLLNGRMIDQVLKHYRDRLSGARLELAEMFLGLRPPVPTEKWPHPGWRPEWRLWLAIWLEHKGRKREAHEIARASLDPRYGNCHSQPALRRLVERTT